MGEAEELGQESRIGGFFFFFFRFFFRQALLTVYLTFFFVFSPFLFRSVVISMPRFALFFWLHGIGDVPGPCFGAIITLGDSEEGFRNLKLRVEGL